MKFLFLALVALVNVFLTSFPTKDSSTLSYALDSQKSVVEWSGSSPRVSHQGSFAVTCKALAIADGHIKSGTFVIPIASIQNFDLPKAIKPVLLKHLKSEDFLHIALYPEATFTITQVAPITTATPNAVTGANAQVTGDFTLLGTTKPLTFPAKIDLAGDSMAVEAQFKLDRTQWGMTYAADPALKNRHIHPEVAIHLKIRGSKS